MKTTYRIPANDPYAYVEIELPNGEKLTDEMIQEACDNYRRATGAIKGHSGLPEKEYRQFIDNQLSGKTIHIDDYEKMNDMQVFAVQVIKRALKRN